MSELQTLHEKYLQAKKEADDSVLDIKKMQDELTRLNLEITELNTQVPELKRTLDDARKGIGMSISGAELLSVRKELTEKQERLTELMHIRPMQENSLQSAKHGRQSSGSSLRHSKDKISDFIANQAASDLVNTANSDLKKLAYTILSKHGYSFSGKPEAYDILFKQIGEKICKKLFVTETGEVALPKMQQAMSERDALIEIQYPCPQDMELQ